MITDKIKALDYIVNKENGYLADLENAISERIIRDFSLTGIIKRGYENDMRASWEKTSYAHEMHHLANFTPSKKSFLQRIQMFLNKRVQHKLSKNMRIA